MLLFVDQTTVSSANEEPQQALNRVEMIMVREGDRWLVDDITSYERCGRNRTNRLANPAELLDSTRGWVHDFGQHDEPLMAPSPVIWRSGRSGVTKASSL